MIFLPISRAPSISDLHQPDARHSAEPHSDGRPFARPPSALASRRCSARSHGLSRADRVDELDLHHLYRAIAWLGEELPETERAARTLAPRCVKDLTEEELFARRRDLFSELSVVFMDTTTLYLEGRGGDTLGHFLAQHDHWHLQCAHSQFTPGGAPDETFHGEYCLCVSRTFFPRDSG
jgi:hypothetical protein